LKNTHLCCHISVLLEKMFPTNKMKGKNKQQGKTNNIIVIVKKNYLLTMGGARGTGAFPKGSNKATQLLKMFVSGKLDISAEPNHFLGTFNCLKNKTAVQVHRGFNQFQELAKGGNGGVSGRRRRFFEI
jgi:hypothetical protein